MDVAKYSLYITWEAPTYSMSQINVYMPAIVQSHLFHYFKQSKLSISRVVMNMSLAWL